MNKLFLTIAVLALSVNMSAFADQAEQVITLKDGSQIKGQLAGIENGEYTIKTPIIGDVHVAANDVASITNGGATVSSTPQAAAATNPNMDQQIMAQQQKLIGHWAV